MRYFTALVFCCLLASTQVHACRGVFSERELFFEIIPNPQPDADVIAKVSLSNINDSNGTATATIMQALKTSDARVRQGDKIAMEFVETSCGPGAKNGDEGTIIAKLGADSEGRPVLCPYTRQFGNGHITLRSWLRKYGCPDVEYFKTKCVFSNVKFPEEMLVAAAGGHRGRELNFQIDQSGSAATQFDVAVNSPSRPVALILNAGEPTIWNIGWTEGTKIAAVFVSGYRRQAVAGLDSAVPVLNSSRSNGGGCGYSYETQKENRELDRISRQLFGKPPDLLVPGDRNGTIVIGEPLDSETRLVTSTAVSSSSFRDPGTPLAGKAGLDDAMAKGLIRPATAADADAWVAAVAAANLPPNVPPTTDQGMPKQTRPSTHRAFVVLKAFTYPAGLHGAHSATFFIPKGIPLPKGNPGHSQIHDFRSLQCRGSPPECPRR